MSTMTTYLIFEGNCKAAMEFYQRCLGGALYMMPYSDTPDAATIPEGNRNWIIHARLTVKDPKGGPTMVLMASDTRPDLPIAKGNNFFVCLTADNVAAVEKLYNALAEGGTPEMPLQETFWANRYGMLTDKFGVKWMVGDEKQKK